ncbi:MAG: hypothetical protein HUK25_02770 [Treponema sp.]|nr:hypothetical protein [Treponema sp.]
MKKYLYSLLVISLMLAMFTACSSSPKRAMVFSEITSLAYDSYEKANAAIIQGDRTKAASLLQDAYKRAVSVDNNELVCKILLSSVSYRILFAVTENVNSESESKPQVFIFSDTPILIEKAKICAAQTEKKEYLDTIIAVYETRSILNEAQKTKSYFNNEKQQKNLDACIKTLEKEPYYLAYLYRTKGECYSHVSDFLNAELCFEKAAEIHTQSRYLKEISYDWYLAAQAYSKDGKKENALTSIQNALKYDKDAENPSGIAQDYIAAAKILIKGNYTEAEKQKAVFYAEKAALIYESIENFESAEATRNWISENLE